MESPTLSTRSDAASRPVRFASGVAQAGFTVAHNVVLFDLGLSPLSRLLYLQLRHYAWADTDSFPGQDDLAKGLGVGARMLRNYLRELEEADLLETEQRGRGMTSAYVVREPLDRKCTSAQPGNTLPGSKEQQVEKTEDKTLEASPLPPQIDEVYDHWRTERGKTRSNYNQVSEGRRKKILARLREFSAEDLKRAIDGVGCDPWPERSKHDDITIIFRSREQVDKFLDLADEGPARRSLTPQEIARRAIQLEQEEAA